MSRISKNKIELKEQSLYKYEATEEIIEETINILQENTGYREDENSKKDNEKWRRLDRETIKDFLDKFDIYYTDEAEEFTDKKFKAQALQDYQRSNYEITLVSKQNKHKKFRTFIGLPLMSHDDRYCLDLEYIFSALSFSAATSDDMELENEKDEKWQNQQSLKLWNFLDILEDKESFWVHILNGSY